MIEVPCARCGAIRQLKQVNPTQVICVDCALQDSRRRLGKIVEAVVSTLQMIAVVSRFIGTKKCSHYWDINERNEGRCRVCGTTRTFI